jgi:hypothetical protein
LIKKKYDIIKIINFEFVCLVLILIPLAATYIPINFQSYSHSEKKHLIFPEIFIYSNMDGLQDLGRWMHENIDENKTVAVGDVGAIGYYFHGKITDMWGLNSIEVSQYIKNYEDYRDENFVELILDMNPEYIILKAFEKIDNGTEIYFHRYLRPNFLENENFVKNYNIIHYQVWKSTNYYILYEHI